MSSTVLTPIIDVIIPVYNGERFIVAALDSVVAQTLAPHSVIVVDDGSTDTTPALVEEYRTHSPVEIILVHKENGGLSSARNAGIAQSTAPYIAFLDADDTWEKDKLEKQLRIFTETSFLNLGLVYCDYDLIDTEGNKDLRHYKVPLERTMRGMTFERLLPANKILSSGSGVLIKKSVFDTVGVFDETLRFGEDWDMWLRIAEKFEVDYCADVLVHIRRHATSMTSPKRTVFIGEIAFYKKWVPLLKSRGCGMPLWWRLKILFRILTQLHNTDVVKSALPLLLVPFRQSIDE